MFSPNDLPCFVAFESFERIDAISMYDSSLVGFFVIGEILWHRLPNGQHITELWPPSASCIFEAVYSKDVLLTQHRAAETHPVCPRGCSTRSPHSVQALASTLNVCSKSVPLHYLISCDSMASTTFLFHFWGHLKLGKKRVERINLWRLIRVADAEVRLSALCHFWSNVAVSVSWNNNPFDLLRCAWSVATSI